MLDRLKMKLKLFLIKLQSNVFDIISTFCDLVTLKIVFNFTRDTVSDFCIVIYSIKTCLLIILCILYDICWHVNSRIR